MTGYAWRNQLDDCPINCASNFQRYLRASGTYNPGGSATPTTTDNGVPVPTPTGPIYSAPGTNRSTASASATAPVSGTTTTNAAAAVLTGLHFWRANVGVAFRF